MAVEYAKVLKALNRDFIVIGRGAASAAAFSVNTGVRVLTGGLDYLIGAGSVGGAQTAIVAVGVEQLYHTSLALLKLGVKRLLIEKPGGLHPEEITRLNAAVKANGAKAYVAYNRRFLASVRRAREMIEEDGGLNSFFFDFTERSHEIEGLTKAPGVKERWVLGNSSHVIDLAFFLGGSPTQFHAMRAGAMKWHPAGAVFVGSGKTSAGTPFSYHADWDAPGRWSLEFCTFRHKLILRPMEILQVMRKGTMQIEEVAASADDVRLDAEFKPGLYREVEAFFSADDKSLCTLDEQTRNLDHLCEIAGYPRAGLVAEVP